MHRYYLSGSDAFRLKLMLPLHPDRLQHLKDEELAAEQLDKLSVSPMQATPSSSNQSGSSSVKGGNLAAAQLRH